MSAIIVEVSAAQVGQRIDNFLITYLKGVPKSRIYKAIRRGEVRVGGGRIKQTYRLAGGDKVRIPPISWNEKESLPPPSERWQKSMRACVMLETPDVMIINKPPGMPVHAGTGIERGLIENLKASPEFASDWELAHRIDRETSGCLMLAKQGLPLKELHDIFRSRTIQKGYFLWVKGRWHGDERVVNSPLERTLGGGGERMVIVSDEGQSAETTFTPIVCMSDRSLLWAAPKTGRTHQIRVHAVCCGHPIIGDAKYGDVKYNQSLPASLRDRLFLHAASLQLEDQWSHLSICAVLDPQWALMASKVRISTKGLMLSNRTKSIDT